MKFSTTLRNSRANAIITAAGTNPKVKFYTGTESLTPAGTLLATLSVTGALDIEATLRKLRLSGMAETLQTRLMQAQAAQEPFLDTLSALLQDELDRRHSRLMARS